MKSIRSWTWMSTTILSLNPNRKPSLLATFLSFFLPTLTLVDAAHIESKRDQFVRARRAMIERDLVSRGIRDRRVLEAMGSIERELFVPEKLRSLAYDDRRRANHLTALHGCIHDGANESEGHGTGAGNRHRIGLSNRSARETCCRSVFHRDHSETQRTGEDPFGAARLR